MAMMAFHLSAGNSSIGATCWMPALLTRMSTAPKFRSVSAISASISWASPRPLITTPHPLAAKASAMPRPMSLVEPVTITVFPFSILRLLLLGAAALWSTGQVARPAVSAAAGDEARAALKGHIGPQPSQGDDDAIAQADQEIDVDEAPKQPGEPSGQLDKTEIGDRCLTA